MQTLKITRINWTDMARPGHGLFSRSSSAPCKLKQTRLFRYYVTFQAEKCGGSYGFLGTFAILQHLRMCENSQGLFSSTQVSGGVWKSLKMTWREKAARIAIL